MKKTLLPLLIASLAFSGANAATVALNKGISPGFTVQNKDGQAVTSYLFVGSFATAPTTPVGGDYASILSAFRSFDVVADAITINSGSVIGAVAASWANVPTTAANFNGQQMYLLISNTPDYANATQIGLFTNSPVTNFVADVSTATSSNYNVGTFASNVVVAGAGSKVDNASGADVLRLVAVPEPSVALLGALGVFGLIRRRR